MIKFVKILNFKKKNIFQDISELKNSQIKIIKIGNFHPFVPNFRSLTNKSN